MPAFTDLAGVPLTANRGLLTGTLREEWGFDGVVISDYGAIGELIRHGVAADVAEAAALALNAGVDIDMMSLAYRDGLPAALDRGLVAEATIDAAVARVLALKRRLGLLDDPYRRCAGPDRARPPSTAPPRPHAATRSIVLLQERGRPPAAACTSAASRSSARSPTRRARCSAPGPAPAAATRRSASSPASAPPSPTPRIEHVAGVPIEGDAPDGIDEAVAAARARRPRHPLPSARRRG